MLRSTEESDSLTVMMADITKEASADSQNLTGFGVSNHSNNHFPAAPELSGCGRYHLRLKARVDYTPADFDLEDTESSPANSEASVKTRPDPQQHIRAASKYQSLSSYNPTRIVRNLTEVIRVKLQRSLRLGRSNSIGSLILANSLF